MKPERWDVFCKVVDNFGDAGVAWRLARSLSREHGKAVRLWIGELEVLARLRPEIDPALALQQLEGVEVARWRRDFADQQVADVIVETFGCEAPEAYVAAMARRQPFPRWINLEYLSAEAWVEGSHALPSPHPRLPLTRHYYFPGFTPRTGGLLREASLVARRDAFQGDAQAQSAFWLSLCGREPPAGAIKLSVFAYAGAPLASLLDALARGPRPAWCVVPAGAAAEALADIDFERGSLTAQVIPFVSQDRYDELLWACDVNFVRGEDSFVRAQWAARPFAWHIYPQEEGAHWVKLKAFLERYGAGLGREHLAAVTGLWEAWNRGDPVAGEWAAFADRLGALEEHARGWARAQSARPDLAAGLVDFADNVLK